MRCFAMPICLCAAMFGASASALGPSSRDSGDAAHLFAYAPKPGMTAAFEAGYRRHLQWHRDHRDPLVWYGWTVSDGARAGLFVDGSFGAPFAAFDARVDPNGDGADADRNVTPYADTAWRSSYRLRREFGTGRPLEQWRPSKRMRAVHYRLRPGMRSRFERVLAAAHAALVRDPAAPVQTWYERVTGGDTPGYLLLIAREDWVGDDRGGGDLDTLLAGDPQAPSLLADLAAAVIDASTETWTYRADLSLIPPR